MQIYCFQLGMIVDFSYCFSMQEKLPCRNIIGCWMGRIDIEKILTSSFDRETLRGIFGEIPKSKIEKIFEILSSLKNKP